MYFIWQKQNQIYQNTFKNFQNNKRNVSFVYPRCTGSVHCVCVCVLEMRHWFRGSYHKDPDPYSQKAFHRRERRSWISDQAPLVHKISLKGKTHEGSAPKLCRCSSSTKDIQINKVGQRRQRGRSAEIWRIPGRWSKADLDGESRHMLPELRLHVRVCVCV